MPLACPHCKSVYNDPGGDVSHLACAKCGFRPLKRTIIGTGENDTAIGLMAGAAVGAAFGGPAGAVIGGILGALLGAHQNSPNK
jgi:uncharacterized membrane protein